MKCGKMMKGIGVAALALTVVSSCIVGGTLAKYTTSVAGTGAAIVARWAPSFGDGTDVFSDGFTVDLSDAGAVTAGKVAADRIAPGTKGEFAVEVSNGAATDVPFKYSVIISNLSSNWPANLKFYSDSACTNEITPEADGSYIVLNDSMALSGSESKETKTMYWKWPFTDPTDASSESAQDKKDSDLAKLESESARTITFDIACVAEQLETAPTPAP